MAQSCPQCGATVGDDQVRCPACHAGLVAGGTVLPPRLNPGHAPGPDRIPRSPPAAASPRRKRKPPPAPPRPPVLAPIAVPPLAPAAVPPPAPVAPPPPVEAAPEGRGLLDRIKRRLHQWSAPPPPRPTLDRPPPESHPAEPAPLASPPPPTPLIGPVHPPVAAPPPEDREPRDATVGIGGVDLDRLKIPQSTYTLQICDTSGQWRDWGPIPPAGKKVGRGPRTERLPALDSMAERHLRLSYDRRARLVVEDLDSLNGVYLRIDQPVPLSDGTRFRIGGQTLEFRHAEPFEPAARAVAENGEAFCSRDLEPLAYVDLIRPNNRPGLRFPITRTGPTVLGRGGPSVQIALSGDDSASAAHARIERVDGAFVLADLESRNGTFVHVLGPHVLKSGDILLAGQVMLRVVNHALA